MATSPLGGFANLSRYQQAAVQPQPNIMDQFVQALNQGISLGQLPQTLQAEAQQKQQQSILNAIRVATAQKQFEELNKTPEQRLAERFQESLIAQSYDPLSGVGRAVPGFEGQVVATPGAITPEQQNLLALRDAGVQAGGIPLELPTAPLGTPITPVLTPRGVPTGFTQDISVPTGIAEQVRLSNLANLRDQEAAKSEGRFPIEKAKIEAQAAARGVGATKNTVLSSNAILVGPNGEILASNPVGSVDRIVSSSPGTKIINATTGAIIFDNPALAATEKPVKLNSADEKFVDTLSTKNANKISIAGQIDSSLRILQDKTTDPTTKIKEGQRLLKVLNSSEGQDAVGVEESKRLGSLIEFQLFNPRGILDPTQQVYGVNLPGFINQLNTASTSIKNSVQENQKQIDATYGKYGVQPVQATIPTTTSTIPMNKVLSVTPRSP